MTAPDGLPYGRGSARRSHNPDYVKYLPPLSFWKVNPHGGLFISVPASPLSQRRERSAGKPPPFMMAFSQFQRCLRPMPPTPPDHWSAPAPPSPLQSPPHRLHPTRITGTTRETLTEPEQVRPGEESGTAHTHPRLHPASREQTLLRLRGVMNAPSSAPPPAIRQQSSSQPTHHAAYNQSLLEACCRIPQRGQRYPDVRQPAPQSATHSGWSEKGRGVLTDTSSQSGKPQK